MHLTRIRVNSFPIERALNRAYLAGYAHGSHHREQQGARARVCARVCAARVSRVRNMQRPGGGGGPARTRGETLGSGKTLVARTQKSSSLLVH